MSGADEEWVTAAMTDDAMVVDLLVRLHHSPPPLKPTAFSLEWTVRQRRSKSVSLNKKPPHRGSPTTPLSWSGATSLSGGSDDSTRPVPIKHSGAVRSKVNVDCGKIVCKRSRKKKTMAELKDDENLLLRERRELKKEMAALRLNLERQRAKNENLKRMKIELQPRLASAAEESVSGHSKHDCYSNISRNDGAPELCTSNAAEESDSRFTLPDLNMPFDESFSNVVS